MNIYGEYFYGNKISDYGLEKGFVDYATLAKAFDAVYNGNILQIGYEIGCGWEIESGLIDHADEIEDLRDEVEKLQETLDSNETWLDELLCFEDIYNDPVAKRTFEKVKAETDEIEAKIRDKEAEIESLEDEQDTEPEVFQWYIVSDSGANILEEINEIVYYHADLDIYLWGVTHFGTAWDYVLTDIPCNTGKI